MMYGEHENGFAFTCIGFKALLRTAATQNLYVYDFILLIGINLYVASYVLHNAYS